MAFSPELRQLTIAASTQFAAFSVGAAVTFPTLLMEQFGNVDTAIEHDLNTRSWIGSIHGLAGIPAIIMPIVAQKIGRKFGFMISCLFVIVGWVLAYTAKTVSQILVSESFHGFGTNSIMPVAFLSLSEMLSPKYRYVSMQTFSMVHIAGMAVCGILGRYLHYTTVSLVMFISMCLAIGMTAFWPESPYWFACKGRFKECQKAFVNLRGSDDISTKELRELIAAQKENLGRIKVRKATLQGLWAKISRRDFYVPTFHTFMLLDTLYWSGSTVFLIYFIEIVSKTIDNQDATFYASITMYVIFLAGAMITTFLVIRFKNKTIIMWNAFGLIFFLASGVVVTGLQTLSLLPKDSYLLLVCLIGYTACNGLSTVYLVAAEIMPVKHRNIGGALYIIFNCTLLASSLKLSPYLFLYVGLCGTFTIYLVNAVLCTLFLWKCVPETKGRTLQELEDYYNNGHFVQRCYDDADDNINQKVLLSPAA